MSLDLPAVESRSRLFHYLSAINRVVLTELASARRDDNPGVHPGGIMQDAIVVDAARYVADGQRVALGAHGIDQPRIVDAIPRQPLPHLGWNDDLGIQQQERRAELPDRTSLAAARLPLELSAPRAQRASDLRGIRHSR
jgi:hypothetical protein